MKRLSALGRWMGKHLDASDIVSCLGYGFLFYGLWLKDPATAFVVVGGAFVVQTYAPTAAQLILAIRLGNKATLQSKEK